MQWDSLMESEKTDNLPLLVMLLLFPLHQWSYVTILATVNYKRWSLVHFFFPHILPVFLIMIKKVKTNLNSVKGDQAPFRVLYCCDGLSNHFRLMATPWISGLRKIPLSSAMLKAVVAYYIESVQTSFGFPLFLLLFIFPSITEFFQWLFFSHDVSQTQVTWFNYFCF